MSLFVDTSIWYAAADSSDPSKHRAKAILAAGEALVTTDHVLVETWTLLRYRIRRQAAERFWGRTAQRSRRHRTSRSGIERAASLDDDFAIFRFGPNRRRAFTILR